MGFAIVGALFGAEGTGFGAVATGIIVPFVQSVTTLAFAFDGKRGPRGGGDPAVGAEPAATGGGDRVRRRGARRVAAGAVADGADAGARFGCSRAAVRGRGAVAVATDRLGAQAVTGVLKLVVISADLGAVQRLGVPPLAMAVAVVFQRCRRRRHPVMARAMGSDAP
jgi:hypothetical protein